MIRSNGTGQNGDAVGSRHTPGLDETRGSVSPLRRPRGRRARRFVWTRRPSPPRLSTVWPCAQGEHRDGNGLLADWLLNAVVKIVTTYTEPGQRVLLLAPPPGADGCESGLRQAGTSPGRSPDGGLHAGLHEAAWTVVRLGRGIQTYTVSPTHGPTDDPIAEQTGPQGRRLEPEAYIGDADPDSADTSQSDSHAQTQPITTPSIELSVERVDPFDLIVAAVDPHAPRWVHTWGWDRLLTPRGTLTVITHSDTRAGRLVDVTGSLVQQVRRTGLTYRDHVALLRVPVQHGVLRAGTGSAPDARLVPASIDGTPIRPAQVHSDLLVFAKCRMVDSVPARTETSDV